MAPTSISLLLAFAIFVVLLGFPGNVAAGKYSAIINFGDSLSDTGNTQGARKPPYGETYFHRPTGRCSDGRLIIDFIAQALELPLLPPNLGGNSSEFATGVNFAVSGATALDADYFRKRGLNVTIFPRDSLGVQIDRFKQTFPTPESARNILSTALVLIGEIGGNDYMSVLMQLHNIEEARAVVPDVVNFIISSAESLINQGATRLVVPGITPLGCVASLLTLRGFLRIPGGFDPKTGCLTALNNLAQYHGQTLKTSVQQLQTKYPSVTISYADYYEGFIGIYNSPSEHGFTGGLAACCGGGGPPYNADPGVGCGIGRGTLCSDPSKYIGWDGIHYTEAAYNVVANGIIHGPLANPPILS